MRRSLIRSEASASGERGEVVDAGRRLGRRRLEHPPRPAADVDRDEPRGGGGKHVVVDPVADVGDLRGVTPGELDDELEEARIRLLDAQARRRRDDVGRQRLAPWPSAPSAPAGCRRCRRAGREPAPTRGRRSRPDTGLRARTRGRRPRTVGRSTPRWRQSSLCSSPRSIVTPSAAQIDVRLQARALGEHAPPALLVDEGLADVEEDGLQSHDSTSARSAAVVTFSSRRSPSTTRILPPRASTSDAQSEASIGSVPR